MKTPLRIIESLLLLSSPLLAQVNQRSASANAAPVLAWGRQFGTSADDDGCGAICCDAQGEVFLTGATEGKIGERQFGGTDAFLIKVSAAGSMVWACQWGTAGADISRGLAADADGNLYATGSTSGCMDGPANAGNTDIFLSKIDGSGKLAWNRQFGTPAPDQGMNVRIGADRSIYVGGWSGGNFAGPQLGEGDSVLLKLNPTGKLLWRKQFGTVRWDGIHGIALSTDGSGDVVAGGCQNWDKCQGFIRKFDAAGRELCSALIPTPQVLCGTQIATDGNGDIYQTGGTHGPAFGDYGGSGTDIILVKFTTDRSAEPPPSRAVPPPSAMSADAKE